MDRLVCSAQFSTEQSTEYSALQLMKTIKTSRSIPTVIQNYVLANYHLYSVKSVSHEVIYEDNRERYQWKTLKTQKKKRRHTVVRGFDPHTGK